MILICRIGLGPFHDGRGPSPSTIAKQISNLLARVIVCCLIFSAVCPQALPQESEPIARFKSAAPSAWEEYRRYAKDMVGRYDLKGIAADGKLLDHFAVEFKQNDGCRLFVANPLVHAKLNEIEAYVQNKDYFFVAKKKKEASVWVMTQISTNNDQQSEFVASRMSTLTHGFDLLLRLTAKLHLPELLGRADFKLLSARPVDLEGKEFVEIEFTATHDIKKDRSISIERGLLVLDPAHFWCLRKATLDTYSYPDVSGRDVIECTYRSEGPNVPIPETIISRGKVGSKVHGKMPDYESRWDCKVRLLSSKLSDQEFSLTAFGLPEPLRGKVQQQASSWWIILVGLVLIGGAAWLYRRGRNATRMEQ